MRASVGATVGRGGRWPAPERVAAFRDDWRLATANGLSARRMYAAGATLEVATRVGEGAVGATRAPPTRHR